MACDRVTIYTHRGWFGLCPVYICEPHSPSGPALEERHWSLAWLFTLSEWLFNIAFTIKCWMDDEYEPEWPIRITGRLEAPIVRSA